jgi:uncharacterized protein with PQ loop repeat
MELHVDLGVMTLIVVMANALGAGMAIPQAVRLIRGRRTDGVSTVWAAMSIAVNSWWLAYGVGTGDPAIVPVAAVSVAAYGAVAVALARFCPGRSPADLVAPLVAATTVGVIPLLALQVGGWPATGIALGAIYGVQLSPAVIKVYRSADVGGVSAATWMLAWSEAVSWGIYGVAKGDAGLTAFGVTGFAVSTAILARLVSHPTARPGRSRPATSSRLQPVA